MPKLLPEMSTTLKAFHDELLLRQPEGAVHDPSDCPFCSPAGEVASASTPGGAVAEKTYNEGEYNALVSQVSALQAQVAELTAITEASQVDAKVAAARAELESQVADLQSQLDAAVLEGQTHKTQYDNLVAWLDGEATAQREAAEIADRKQQRLAQVKEVASFPDVYLQANADRFAAMSDEAFTASLEDWKAITAKAPGSSSAGDIPNATAMTASSSGSKPDDVLKDVLGLRFLGVDTRTA